MERHVTQCDYIFKEINLERETRHPRLLVAASAEPQQTEESGVGARNRGRERTDERQSRRRTRAECSLERYRRQRTEVEGASVRQRWRRLMAECGVEKKLAKEAATGKRRS
ncbi:hypothetical protein AXF42_Ash004416 [Apostasia shenzhenica]|uniref:Uncharacterized protein n=1 Tax=Apostasia shenzhenica TaxID=1088818 RepID=A0A2I0A2W4_9ASPA|nr:hypothetical protein AXF42_Ash004416 [Apostasia shenzhenica]